MLAAFAPAPRHPGPPVWAELLVEGDELLWSLHGEPGPLAELVGSDKRFVGPFAGADEERRLEEQLRAGLADVVELEVDGRPARPTFEGVTFPEDRPDLDGGWLVVDVAYRVALAEPARRVAIRWRRFDGCRWGGERFVPITLRHGRLPEVASVWPEEPELVWHAPLPTLEAAPPPALPAPPSPEPRWRVPLASVASLSVAALAAAAAGRRRARAALGALAIGGAAAFGLRGAWLVPLGSVAPEPPTRAEALAIFDRLHAAVYEAFEARTEDAIYDRLAAAVAPELVDGLYGDVYESLVMRAEGGAVCAVERVDVRERELEPGASPARFRVESAWDVHGLVSHWGHVHRRRNAYRARHTIAAYPDEEGGGRAWKIAAVEVLQHERVDE